MPQIIEINRIEELADYGPAWDSLLNRTPGASFFQSFRWLSAYWRHFGAEQRLRVLVAVEDDIPIGILPLTVLTEKTRVGRLRTLTYPLHNWGSFYGPIGPEPAVVLQAGLEHIRQTRRDWDILELRWHGNPMGGALDARGAMTAAGFQSYPTVWDQTAIVNLDGNWEGYWSTRKSGWLRKFRAAEKKLQSQGELKYIRLRPGEEGSDNTSPHWDVYDACEKLAANTWQAGATDGTTLSDDSVRGFLRESHEAAAAAGAADLNLLTLDGEPAAFIYGYQSRGYVYGLRRGFDQQLARYGAGNVLLAYTIRDSFARGDRVYDMGIGSLETKRYFQTRLVPIMRYSHFSPGVLRTHILRMKRWWQSKRLRVETFV